MTSSNTAAFAGRWPPLWAFLLGLSPSTEPHRASLSCLWPQGEPLTFRLGKINGDILRLIKFLPAHAAFLQEVELEVRLSFLLPSSRISSLCVAVALKCVVRGWHPEFPGASLPLVVFSDDGSWEGEGGQLQVLHHGGGGLPLTS